MMLELPALADPTRRKIVELLADRERTAGDIAGRFDATPPAISQHLKVLREARLVRVRVDGQRRIYTLDPAGFESLDHWLDRIRRFWSVRLDVLEQELLKPESTATPSADVGARNTKAKTKTKRGRKK